MGSSGYCKVSLPKSSAIRLMCISLAQSFAHCSQAVGSGGLGGIGEGGGDGNKGSGDDDGDGGDIKSFSGNCVI